jgi:hypothetical protein
MCAAVNCYDVLFQTFIFILFVMYHSHMSHVTVNVFSHGHGHTNMCTDPIQTWSGPIMMTYTLWDRMSSYS